MQAKLVIFKFIQFDDAPTTYASHIEKRVDVIKIEQRKPTDGNYLIEYKTSEGDSVLGTFEKA